MAEVNRRLQEYQEALQKRDDYIARLSSSLQSTIQQRDELQQSAQHEAQKLAQEITILREQLQQTSAFLRDKDFSGINAAEFITLKNQLIALNSTNASQLEEIANLKSNLDVKSQALRNAEGLVAQHQSVQKQNHEELERARSETQQAERRQTELESQLERLQKETRHTLLEKTALEESFSRERAMLTSKVEQYTSQLSEQSLLNESLSVTQGRVSELTSQLEAAAHQLNDVTSSAARTEAQLRQKMHELEQQLLERTAAADRLQLAAQPTAADRLQQQQLEERFGEQLSQITGELRSSHSAELAALKNHHQAELSELRAGLETQLQQLRAERQPSEAPDELAELSELRRGREQHRLLVKSLRAQLAKATDRSAQQEQQLRVAAGESRAAAERLAVMEQGGMALTQQARVATEARDALTAQLKEASDQLRAAADEKNVLAEKLKTATESSGTLQHRLLVATEEKNALAEQLKTVTDDRDELTEQVKASADDRNSLNQQLQTLAEERDTLKQQMMLVDQVHTDTGFQLSEANQQRDQLCRALAVTNQQREELSGQLTAANQQQEELSRQLVAANQQREELTRQLTAASQQREKFSEQLAASNQQQEDLARQLVSTKDEREKLGQQLTAANQEREDLSHQLTLATQDREEITRKLTAATKERDELREQLNTVSEQHQVGSRQLEDATLLHAEAAQQLNAVTDQRDQLNVQLSALGQQQAALGQQLAEVTGQRDELDRQLREGAAREDRAAGDQAAATAEVMAARQELREVIAQREIMGQEMREVVQRRDALEQELTKVTEHRDALLAEVAKVTENRGTLKLELSKVTEQGDVLVRERDAACQEKESFSQLLKEITEQRDKLENRHESLTAERERLEKDIQTVSNARDSLMEELRSTSQRTDELARELQGTTQQLHSASSALSEVSQERDKLQQQWDSVQQQHATLQQQQTTLTKQLLEVTQQCDSLTQERDSLIRERDSLTQERDSLTQQLAIAGQQATQTSDVVEQWRVEMERHTAAAAQMRQSLEASRGEQRRLETELGTIVEQRDGLRSELEAAGKERDGLRSELTAVGEERDKLRSELELERRDQAATVTELQSRVGEGEAAAAHLVSQLAEAEKARRRGEEELTRLKADGEAAISVFRSQVAAAEAALQKADSELAASRAELAELTASEAALRGDRAVAKDASNTAIKLRARVETLSRKLEETERRAEGLERERAMLQETHQKYIGETNGQLVAAQAEAEKLRACLLVQSVTSPRRESKTMTSPKSEGSLTPKREGNMTPKRDGMLLPKRNAKTLGRSESENLSLLMKEFDGFRSPRKDVLAVTVSGKEVHAVNSARRALNYGTPPVEDRSNAVSPSSPPSAADSGLTAGSTELSGRQLSQLESLVLTTDSNTPAAGVGHGATVQMTAGEAGLVEGGGDGPMVGEVQLPESSAVTRLLRRLCARLAAVLRDKQLLQRRLRSGRNGGGPLANDHPTTTGAESRLRESVIAEADSPRRDLSPEGSPVQTARSGLSSSPSVSLGVLLTDRTCGTASPTGVSPPSTTLSAPPPSAPTTARSSPPPPAPTTAHSAPPPTALSAPPPSAPTTARSSPPPIGRSAAPTPADCALEAAEAVRAALTASERQQAQLLQLEARVSSELAELQLGLKSAVEQGADASAAIILIDASYEVRLLKSKLAACSSINAALHEQLRVHHRVVVGFQRLFARIAEEGRVSDSALVEGDSPASTPRSVHSGRDVTCDSSPASPNVRKTSGAAPPEAAEDRELPSFASPKLRDAPCSDPWPTNTADSEAWLREAGLTDPQLIQLLTADEARPPAGDGSVTASVDVSELQPAANVPDPRPGTPEVPPFDLRLLDAASPSEADPFTGCVSNKNRRERSREKEVAQRLEPSGDGDAGERPQGDGTDIDGGGEGDGRDGDGDGLQETLLSDLELLDSLVRENGTLRRALLFEKGRGQRLLAAEQELRERHRRAEEALHGHREWTEEALSAADRRQALLLDCVQRQQEAISGLQHAVLEGGPASAAPDLSTALRECRDSLQAHTAAREAGREPREAGREDRQAEQADPAEAVSERLEATQADLGRLQAAEADLARRKLDLDEANQLLQLRDRELERLRDSLRGVSSECDQLRRASNDLVNRLKRAADTVRRLYRLKDASDRRCRRLKTEVGRSELVMDLERALWEVESRRQLMEHEQRLYQHFLPSLPPSQTSGGASPEAAREVWLFPTGQPPPASPSRARTGETPHHPDGESTPAPPGPGTVSSAPDAAIAGCADLFSRVEDKLQTEFHSMVQALSVQWTERSLEELRRCRPGEQEQDQERQDQDQERRQLQRRVRELQDWLEDTYRHQLQWLHQKLGAQKDQVLQRPAAAPAGRPRIRRSVTRTLHAQPRRDSRPVESEILEKARSLSGEPHMVIETLRGDNDQLRMKLAELRQHQTGLEQQVAEHEQELNSLREYFQEKVKFTENMYSDEIRRLIQQHSDHPEEAGDAAGTGPADGGEADDLAGLGGSFTDLALPEGAEDTAGPSVLRLRVEFERRVASLRRQLERRVASRSRDVRTELERRHRQEVTELERKHLSKLAQTVERYKKELEAGRRDSEKQISEMRNQLVQQHQDELRRIARKERLKERPDDAAGRRDGGGDAGGDGGSGDARPPDADDGRRQVLLAELENLSFEMKKQNESEQAAFLEQQRVSLERFARQQERSVRQLEARQQAARDEAAQAERELAALRAQSAEAEIRRDQEAARWKLELATGYETQIKAVLAGVTLDEDTAASVSQLRAALQRDGGAALAELEAAHQAALRALEKRHERQQRELRLQLEAASRRERHLQETLAEELHSLRERLGAEPLHPCAPSEGLSLELEGLRLHLCQLEQARHRLGGTGWSATEHGAVIEVAREELEMLHRDREEQGEQLQQLGDLVRALCQYYHTSERLHRPAPSAGRSADPEAEATDRMVLEALAPDEGVALWAERGRQLPRVQRCVREATARLQATAVPVVADQKEAERRETERAERAERRVAELERRVDGLTAELTAARERLAEAEGEEREEREALGESRPPGQPPPQPEVTLQCIRQAAEALLTTPSDPGDSRLLLSRVHQLEALLSELTVQSDQMVADCNREVDDVKQQMVAADKQLRAARAFLDEITTEREAERDEFGRETARLAELVAARERERDEQALRRRQLEAVETQNAELLGAAHDSEQERGRLRDELKAAVDKIHDLRDIIRSLESQLDQMGAAEDRTSVDRLKTELIKQTNNSKQLQKQLAGCKCGAGGVGGSGRRPDGGSGPPLPPLDSTADSGETTLSVCPSLLQELRDQILRMETDVDQRAETLENSFSSAAETVSPAGSRQELSHRPVGDDLSRLRQKLDRLVSVEEAALARLRNLETELTRSRASQQDLLSEREQLQQQLSDQLLQLSALRARLERSRLAAEVGSAGEQEKPDRARLAYLQTELESAGRLIRSKEKQLADMSCQLEETRRRLIVREAELSRLGREREAERERTPRESPATSPRDATELRALRVKYRALQLQHQELMAQLRENNLPEFVERLLSDKNVQIEELERNVRSLTQQSMRSASAGDRSSVPITGLSSLSDEHQPSPELLRREAASTHSDPAGDLSRPDISMAYPSKEEPSPPSAARPPSPPPSPRPPSPPAGSERSWDSAPTEPGGGGSRLGSSASAPASSAAASSASGDSIHNLRAALARKKQLLNARKEQLERSAQGVGMEQQQQHSVETPMADSPAQPPPAEESESARLRHQLAQLRGRLDILNPILARLDADYRSLADDITDGTTDGITGGITGGIAKQKAPSSETELRLAAEVAKRRRVIEGQDRERQSLERDLQLMDEQGVPKWDPRRLQLEEQLFVTLRDMEISKLEACSRMHEAAALLARRQRHAQQEETDRHGPDSELASSGYLSEMPETAASPPGRPVSQSPKTSPALSPETSPALSPRHGPTQNIDTSSAHSPATSPLRSPRSSERQPALQPTYQPALQPTYQPAYQPSYQEQTSDSMGESAFESGVTEFESDTERAGSTCDARVDSRSSCPSLIDEMAGLADINAEVDRLRVRISELERELGQRGDAPSADPAPWRSCLEQERAAWSQERQRLQQRIAHLDSEHSRLRKLAATVSAPAGDTEDARLQYAYSRLLRSESYRRALCWQKRYLMVLLGGYQDTEVMTLQRMTQLTGGAFRTDGSRYLRPAEKFRAAVWAVVAVSRMVYMVNRWRSGRRVAGALTGASDPPVSAAVHPQSSSSLVSASSVDATAELDRLGRIVRDCPGSVPDVQFDTRSVASVSDVCTEDLEPYLARFDALLDRQGLPPQPGRRPDNCR